jgi:hypothetical protein
MSGVSLFSAPPPRRGPRRSFALRASACGRAVALAAAALPFWPTLAASLIALTAWFMFIPALGAIIARFA